MAELHLYLIRVIASYSESYKGRKEAVIRLRVRSSFSPARQGGQVNLTCLNVPFDAVSHLVSGVYRLSFDRRAAAEDACCSVSHLTSISYVVDWPGASEKGEVGRSHLYSVLDRMTRA